MNSHAKYDPIKRINKLLHTPNINTIDLQISDSNKWHRRDNANLADEKDAPWEFSWK